MSGRKTLPPEYYRSNAEYLDYLTVPRTKDEMVFWINRGDQFAEEYEELYDRVTHKVNYLKSRGLITVRRELRNHKYVRVYVKNEE